MSRSSLSLLSFNFTIAADSALWATVPAVAVAAPAPAPPAAAFALLDAEEESDKQIKK